MRVRTGVFGLCLVCVRACAYCCVWGMCVCACVYWCVWGVCGVCMCVRVCARARLSVRVRLKVIFEVNERERSKIQT
jgi:hypothetical protein